MNERHCRPGWTMCLLILEPRRLCWASQWTRGLRTRYCSKASSCYLLSSGSNNVIARRILLQPITVWHVYGIGCSHEPCLENNLLQFIFKVFVSNEDMNWQRDLRWSALLCHTRSLIQEKNGHQNSSPFLSHGGIDVSCNSQISSMSWLVMIDNQLE